MEGTLGCVFLFVIVSVIIILLFLVFLNLLLVLLRLRLLLLLCNPRRKLLLGYSTTKFCDFASRSPKPTFLQKGSREKRKREKWTRPSLWHSACKGGKSPVFYFGHLLKSALHNSQVHARSHWLGFARFSKIPAVLRDTLGAAFPHRQEKIIT